MSPCINRHILCEAEVISWVHSFTLARHEVLWMCCISDSLVSVILYCYKTRKATCIERSWAELVYTESNQSFAEMQPTRPGGGDKLPISTVVLLFLLGPILCTPGEPPYCIVSARRCAMKDTSVVSRHARTTMGVEYCYVQCTWTWVFVDS